MVERVDPPLWVNIGTRLDWRSVQSLSCARRGFATVLSDDGVRWEAMRRGVDENWRDGRSFERPLPSELVRTYSGHFATACVAGAPVVAALLRGDRDGPWRANAPVTLFDCRTMAQVARLVNAEPKREIYTELQMATDGRRALILRRQSVSGWAVHFYDPSSKQSADDAVALFQPLLRIGSKDVAIRARASRALDRVLVLHDRSLVWHDVATGERHRSMPLNEWMVGSFCEQDDGQWLAAGFRNQFFAGPQHNDCLLQCDLRSPGT